MNTFNLRNSAFFGYALVALLGSTLAAACGDDEDTDDGTTIPSTGGSKATGGAPGASGAPATGGSETGEGGAAGNPTGTGGSGTGGTAGAGVGGEGEGGGNEGGATNGGEGGGAGAPDCTPQGEYQCYPCAPTSDVEYLNQCSDSECSPFDNADRIPGFTGTLPDL